MPSVINFEAIAAIGSLVLMFIQYIKDALPDKLIRPCSILVGIGMSFLWFYKPGTPIDFVLVIANGVSGAIGADTGYQFLGGSTSKPFSLPSKSNSNPKQQEITILEKGGSQ